MINDNGDGMSVLTVFFTSMDNTPSRSDDKKEGGRGVDDVSIEPKNTVSTDIPSPPRAYQTFTCHLCECKFGTESDLHWHFKAHRVYGSTLPSVWKGREPYRTPFKPVFRPAPFSEGKT